MTDKSRQDQLFEALSALMSRVEHLSSVIHDLSQEETARELRELCGEFGMLSVAIKHDEPIPGPEGT